MTAIDPMPRDEFRETLEELHWSQRDVADLLPCNERLVRRWAAGAAEVPPPVAEWLRKRRNAHRDMPPPSRWKRHTTPAA